MNPDWLLQFVTIYEEGLGKLFPDDLPLRVLTILSLCRQPVTQAEVIERSGFSQSAVSKLLKKFEAAGIIPQKTEDKRQRQVSTLTEKGRQLLSEFDRALLQPATGVETEHANASEAAPAEQTTAVWQEFLKHFPEKLEAYERHLNGITNPPDSYKRVRR